MFDPERDTPPVTPLVDGDRAQRDWCGLMLWGQLVALNVREGRGATQEESVAIAKRAGYRDGRAWNNWTGWRKGEDGGRWATAVGLGHLRQYFETVDRAMLEDLGNASVSDGRVTAVHPN